MVIVCVYSKLFNDLKIPKIYQPKSSVSQNLKICNEKKIAQTDAITLKTLTILNAGTEFDQALYIY